MLNKQQIKQILNYNIMRAVNTQNSGNDTSYYAYMMEVVLDHLRAQLLEKGVRFFRIYLSTFDAVAYYKSVSMYNFSTWMDEQRLKDSINLLRSKINEIITL